MKRLSLLIILMAFAVSVLTFSDDSGVILIIYKTHYYYQTEPNGMWYWCCTFDDRVPEDFHGDIEYYIDYIGYDYMGNFVRLCGEPIYVKTEHSH